MYRHDYPVRAGERTRGYPPTLVDSARRHPQWVQTLPCGSDTLLAVFLPPAQLTVVGWVPELSTASSHAPILNALLTSVVALVLDSINMAETNEELTTWIAQLHCEAEVLRSQYQDCIEQNFRDHERMRQKEQAYAQALNTALLVSTPMRYPPGRKEDTHGCPCQSG